MKKTNRTIQRRPRGQALIEFALILPVLIVILLVLIEVARLFSAWLIVENVTREAARYAVTGQFDPKYCADYATYAPQGCDPNKVLSQSARYALEDNARLKTIIDVGKAASGGILVDFGAARDNRSFFNLVVCSTRSGYTYDPSPYPQCQPGNDAGGAQDRVRIVAVFDHPLITPLRAIADWIPLISIREMVNESFRTVRLRNLPPTIRLPTATPTQTPTPSATSTSTNTPTPTVTSTSTHTPTPTNSPTPSSTPTVTPTPCPSNGTGLRGDYYDFSGSTPPNFAGISALVVSRVDPTVDFSTNSGGWPPGGMATDYFAVRWSGQIRAPYTGSYTFYVNSNNGERLWVNGTLLVDNWTDHGTQEDSGSITLTACTVYTIMLEFYQASGSATAQLSWSQTNIAKQIIPKQYLIPPGSLLPTSTPTRTPTPTITPTPSRTPTITLTPTRTPTPSRTPITPSPTPTRTVCPPIACTKTPTLAPTPTLTPIPSATPTSTPTKTSTPVNTPTKTNTPVVPTWTNTPTGVPPTKTRTPTPTPTFCASC